MPRTRRFTIENGIYHLVCRGNNKQDVFHVDNDFKAFMRLMNHYKNKFNAEVYHYALMNNHIHLILRSLDGDTLARMMKGLLTKYVGEYRLKYGGIGHLWQDRFKSFVIQKGNYMLECGKYIELNPVRANIVISPEDYKWSSYRYYMLGEENKLLTPDPEYLGLSLIGENRQRLYQNYVMERLNNKGDFKSCFRIGAYGDRQYIELLKSNGLIPRKSSSGRPRADVVAEM